MRVEGELEERQGKLLRPVPRVPKAPQSAGFQEGCAKHCSSVENVAKAKPRRVGQTRGGAWVPSQYLPPSVSFPQLRGLVLQTNAARPTPVQRQLCFCPRNSGSFRTQTMYSYGNAEPFPVAWICLDTGTGLKCSYPTPSPSRRLGATAGARLELTRLRNAGGSQKCTN